MFPTPDHLECATKTSQKQQKDHRVRSSGWEKFVFQNCFYVRYNHIEWEYSFCIPFGCFLLQFRVIISTSSMCVFCSCSSTFILEICLLYNIDNVAKNKKNNKRKFEKGKKNKVKGSMGRNKRLNDAFYFVNWKVIRFNEFLFNFIVF